MATITGNEEFWGKIVLSPTEIGYINSSQTLVKQLLRYQNDFSERKISAFTTSGGTGTEFIASGVQLASNYTSWSPELLVGELAHEIGHYINQATDTAFTNRYEVSSNDPNAYSIDAMLGLHREGEAVYNNYIVQQEISTATGGKVNIYLAGALNVNGTSTGLQELLNSQHGFDQSSGCSATQDMNLI